MIRNCSILRILSFSYQINISIYRKKFHIYPEKKTLSNHKSNQYQGKNKNGKKKLHVHSS